MFQNILNAQSATVNGILMACRFTDFFKDQVLEEAYGDKYKRKTERRVTLATQMANALILGDQFTFSIKELQEGIPSASSSFLLGGTVIITKFKSNYEQDFLITFHGSDYKVPNLVSAIKVDGSPLSDCYCSTDVLLAASNLNLFHNGDESCPIYYYENSDALLNAAKLQKELGSQYLVTVERVNTETEGVAGYAA